MARQTSQMKEEGFDHQIFTTRIFGNRGRGQNLDKQNVSQILQCGHLTTRCSKNPGKLWKIAG